MAKLIVEGMGLAGTNVDKNPLELGDDELMQSKNAISDPAAGKSSLRKRPGLVNFTDIATAGVVLGGTSVPVLDERNGTHFIYIGRGPTS